MCIACGSQWPFGATRVHVAPPPTKEETIYVDDTTGFYPDHRQGIHPPGPVYQGVGAAAPNMFTQGMYGAGMYPMQGAYSMQGMYTGMSPYGVPNMCNYQIPGYGAQQFMNPQFGWPYTYSYPGSAYYSSRPYSSFDTLFTTEPPHSLYFASYPLNSTYSPTSLITAATMMPGQIPGQFPGQYPFANSPVDLTAQAAAAAEHNKQIASMPNAPPYIVGANPTDFATQQAMLAQGIGMPQGMVPGMGMAMSSGGANTLAPYKPGEANQFWCRETDGGWTLRGYSEICLGDASPGHWEKHALSGYFFWVRHLS